MVLVCCLGHIKKGWLTDWINHRSIRQNYYSGTEQHCTMLLELTYSALTECAHCVHCFCSISVICVSRYLVLSSRVLILPSIESRRRHIDLFKSDNTCYSTDTRPRLQKLLTIAKASDLHQYPFQEPGTVTSCNFPCTQTWCQLLSEKGKMTMQWHVMYTPHLLNFFSTKLGFSHKKCLECASDITCVYAHQQKQHQL